jgi:hypothetical protein
LVEASKSRAVMLVHSHPFMVIADETDEAAHAKFEQYSTTKGRMWRL